MAVQADTYQLKQIMTPERGYVIPTFQRDYEWTKDGQWQLLFDLRPWRTDLVQPVGRRPRWGRRPPRQKGEVAPHFLGAIVSNRSPRGGEHLTYGRSSTDNSA